MQVVSTRSMRSACPAVASGRSHKLSVSVRAEGGAKINASIRKEEEKVVDMLKVEDLPAPKAVFCRCWKSDKFPYCDGKHVAHNKETGDNVGPLIVETPKA